ncbi:MAG TPA: DUF3592 domain-containing protein [Chloroflexia bacterium]
MGRIDMILALLYILAGIMAFWFAYYLAREARRVRNWPTVYGEMLERGVEGVGQRYRPRVKYRYSAEGKDYVSDQFYSTGKPYGLESTIQKLVDGVPDPVPVHYDPQNPARSYLVLTPTWTVWILVVVGVIALLLGLMQLLTELVGP